MPLTHFIEYLQLEKKYSVHTITAYQQDLISFHDFILKEFDEKELEQVNSYEVLSWIVNRVDSGVSNSVMNRNISPLQSYYKFLLKIKQIEIFPLAELRSLKVARKVQVPFSETDITTALDNNKGDSF